MGNGKAIIDQIYEKLMQLFGESNQAFCMEFPGRVLNSSLYTYETNSIFSNLEKPQPVIEEEFRLSDDLFDVGHISGGPNGSKLSSTYATALNILVPVYEGAGSFNEDMEKTRNWLMEQTQEVIDGKALSRIELFQILYKKYLDARTEWEQTKITKLNAAKNSTDKAKTLEEYSYWLANETVVKEAEIEALYADVITRGYYHKILSLMSYLDISNEGETLEKAKSQMRSSAMGSLDESQTIYPVQFQPNNWFVALSTDFTPEDLLLNPDYLEDKLFQKQQELSDLEMQRVSLSASHTGDEDKLKAEVDKAQSDLDNVQSEMIKNFSDGAIFAVQLYFNHKSDSPSKESDYQNKSGLTQQEWDTIKTLQNTCVENQQILISSARSLSNLQMKLAECEATDTKQALITINSKITALNDEIQNLKNTLLNAQNKSNTPSGTDDKTNLLPTRKPNVGNFMQVTMDFKSSEVSTKSSLSSGSSNTSWSVDLLFGSAGGGSSNSYSNFDSSNMSSDDELNIGFNAAKVTIDRGGWFSPNVFKLASNMYMIDQNSTISTGFDATNFLSISPAELDKINEALFPAFPIAFVIAKDITIKFKANSQKSTEVKNILDKNSSIGGGFFCFSASHSESSHDTSEAYYHSVDSDSVTIKIPGAQILGWFLEPIPSTEKAVKYEQMPSGYLPENSSKLA